jgi:outer membrane protein TolC
MKVKFIFILFSVSLLGWSQSTSDDSMLTFREYLGYVKNFHPIAKQAELTVSVGEANLLRSRGAFDPKINVDYNRKEFKDTEYYDQLNTTFKIPTWYGIELKADFENNSGQFLNPEGFIPDDGLYSAGISASLLQGLLINDRMATLKTAKFFREQTKADRDILVNQILFDAAMAYFNWLKTYQEAQVYNNFLENAQIRFQGIRRSALAGNIAAIDTIEAKIAVENRKLSLEQANLELFKKRLELSNFLWINDVPVELQQEVIPDENPALDIDTSFETMGLTLDQFTLENHPKLRSLNFKIEALDVDRRLKANKLLPRLDATYNFLTETPEIARSLNTFNYKGGINFELPLFLRKERGDLRLAKFKVQDAKFDLKNEEVTIQNKVVAIFSALESFERQNELIATIVQDNKTLLNAEERKFSFGESSLFLINIRELNLINAELKSIEVQNKYFETKAKLFNSLATNPANL